MASPMAAMVRTGIDWLRSQGATTIGTGVLMIENGLRNREAALSHLERSVEAREVQAAFLEIDARWNWIRPDPRFAALRDRLGLR